MIDSGAGLPDGGPVDLTDGEEWNRHGRLDTHAYQQHHRETVCARGGPGSAVGAHAGGISTGQGILLH